MHVRVVSRQIEPALPLPGPALCSHGVCAPGVKAIAEQGIDPGPGVPGDAVATAPFTARVLTLYPEMFPGPLGQSLTGRALADELWRLEPRTSATWRPTATAPSTTRPRAAARGWCCAPTSPRPRSTPPRAGCRGRMAGDLPLAPGPRFDQARARALAAGRGMTLLCGRFEGIDERVWRRGRRGGEPRRLRDDRRRDRRHGLDRRHGSAYTRRPRERQLDGGEILRHRALGVSAIHTPDRMGRSADTRGSPLGASRTDRRLATLPGGEADQGTSSRPLAGLPRESAGKQTRQERQSSRTRTPPPQQAGRRRTTRDEPHRAARGRADRGPRQGHSGLRRRRHRPGRLQGHRGHPLAGCRPTRASASPATTARASARASRSARSSFGEGVERVFPLHSPNIDRSPWCAAARFAAPSSTTCASGAASPPASPRRPTTAKRPRG